MNITPYIVIISGGSGSGKTTFAKALLKNIGVENVQILHQDNYYIDQSGDFDGDGGSVNFDHPWSLDFDLMLTHIESLKKGNSIEVPAYDFATHSRTKAMQKLIPKAVLIVDGTLVMDQKNIRDASDLMIFISCKEELRFSRRLKRDMEERGRTEEGVRAQFLAQVAPMHNQFVEPSQKFSSVLVTVKNFDQKVKEVSLKLGKLV